MRKSIVAIVVGLMLVLGCSERQSETSEARRTGPPLVIGLIPERDIFEQLRRYEPIAKYLSQKIGADILLKPLPRYGNIIKSFEEGSMDGAFFGSFTYVLAHEKLGVEVLARPELLDGRSTYHGLFITRKDSGIRGIQDLKGKVFAFVDRATTAGYLFPLALFRAAGVEDYQEFFRETYFAGTHEAVVDDVLEKRADAGALKNTTFEHVLSENPRIEQELLILARSPVVPENGLAVRKTLDETTKKALREGLLRMHEDPKGADLLRAFGAKRFIKTTDADYEAVVSYAKAVGLNLATYDYVND